MAWTMIISGVQSSPQELACGVDLDSKPLKEMGDERDPERANEDEP